MSRQPVRLWVGLCIFLWFLAGPGRALAADPLPSWNEGPTKDAILEFVAKVTREGGPDFVPPEQRIATFDNDGNLWAEKPVYFQLLYAMEKVREMAADHPAWKKQEPFASVLQGKPERVLAGGEPALMELIAATHSGMTGEQFRDSVRHWLETARHPKTKRRYTEMIYLPMRELLRHLRANGFKTFIVSGGGVDFLRAFAEQTYGIPPEQVVGSTLKASYEMRDGEPTLVKLAEVNLLNDKAGKPVGIYQSIGRRPILASGNSDGDFHMLEYTTTGPGPNLGLLLHHTDSGREWSYDRHSRVGRLERALEAAPGQGWIVVDMQEDWRVVFPFERE